MNDILTQMVEALKAYGLPGLLAALTILVIVFIARKSGLIVTGDQARIANVVIAAILAALSGDPAAETALLTVLTSVLASVIYELLKLVSPKSITAYPEKSQRG